LITYLLVLLVAVTLTGVLAELVGRMRPTGVAMIGPWTGYSHPAAPVALLAAALVGMSYTLVPEGRWRRRTTGLAAVLVGLLCLARLYLGVDHPTDQLAALGIGWAGVIVAFRLLTPEEVFPVHYRRGRTAHLELTPTRRAAIDRALGQQLGLRVESVEPFGLGASAGSTPLRIAVEMADGSHQIVFGKIYALNHLRSDRWYKLSRMVLYGRLEDEKPFSTVRRLAEYEDHMLRLLRDFGLPVPTPYGFVEITPEREYLIVMGFIDDAHDLGESAIDTAVIDSALHIVRRLWQAGVAHRDIKPSNLLEHGGQVELIDVAFATVRPTPWRQAVDLANMMLTLALVGDATLVYERALRLFAPEDIAEAFAACRSITIPSQLRRRLRDHPVDRVEKFRALAPHRPPVRIQVWNMRRAVVTASVIAAALLAVVVVYVYARTAGLL
jgi:tRNA A-37 threonylcarbamoyl transferase component Bud32